MRKVIIAAAALASIALVSPAQADQAGRQGPPKYTVKSITHNIAGGAMHYGKPAALNPVERHIKNFSLDVVLLQEVCASQRDTFIRRHPKWNVYWSETRFSHPNCDGNQSTVDDAACYPAAGGNCAPNGDELGDLIATPHRAGNFREWYLPRPRLGRMQRLSCVDIFMGKVVLACNTHIAAPGVENIEPGVRADQVGTVNSILNGAIVNRRTMVLGGDFNSLISDPWMKPLRRLRSYSHNIDHLFSGGQKFASVRGTYHIGGSDHPLLRSTATYRK